MNIEVGTRVVVETTPEEGDSKTFEEAVVVQEAESAGGEWAFKVKTAAGLTFWVGADDVFEIQAAVAAEAAA